MRRVLAQASLVLALLGLLAFGARIASAAGGNDVEGHGFGARLPAGFRPAASQDEGAGSQRSFRRRVDSGDLRLTFSSCEQADEAFAELEMRLGAALDSLAGLSEREQAETAMSEVRVAGAQKAHQSVARGTDGSERTLMARVNRIIVTVTLAAPADADAEAAEAWQGVLQTLRVDDSSGSFVTVLLVILAGLALLSVGLRLAHGGAARSHAPQGPGGPSPAQADLSPSAPLETYHPRPMPSRTIALPRGVGAGFSRPDDGLAVFDAGTKGKDNAELTLKLPEVRRRAPAAPPAPVRVPNLRPPTPAIRI